jgi:hypothetical protein
LSRIEFRGPNFFLFVKGGLVHEEEEKKETFDAKSHSHSCSDFDEMFAPLSYSYGTVSLLNGWSPRFTYENVPLWNTPRCTLYRYVIFITRGNEGRKSFYQVRRERERYNRYGSEGDWPER